jgi:glycosyltransferase involved in cell wall biosynthesis
MKQRIALDATYSLGDALSGVGVYSREILFGLAASHPDDAIFQWCYRPNRILRSLKEHLPRNVQRRLLRYGSAPSCDLFHALNQRVEFPPGKTKCRIVTTFHDLFVLTGDYSTADFRTRFAEQARRAAERSHAIIAVSQFTADQVRGLLKIGSTPIHVIHHGVNLPAEGLLPSSDTGREDIVLHVGAIQKRKNLERLIQAFETLPESWKLVLVGSVGYGGQAAIDRAAESKAEKRILVMGYLEAEKLEALYRRARILAFPSLDEGFGIPVIEAMSRGVPVLTSDGSALAEVSGGAALLVDPRSTDSIAQGLQTLATSPGLREHLSKAGLQRSMQFSWKRAAAQTWTAYEMTLASN